MKPVYIPAEPHEKAMQRALIQYKKPENYDLVKEALLKEGRNDLIGFDKKCLIPPRKIAGKDSGGHNRRKEAGPRKPHGSSGVRKTKTGRPVQKKK